MAKVIMLCGRICCGKSTYARRLRAELNAAVLSVDEIMLALFGQDAGEKHDEYVERLKGYFLGKAAELAEAGINVVLDWGFWAKAERCRARELYAERGIACELHYIGITDSLWSERLRRRNALVEAGEASDYFVDENLARKSALLFEEPAPEEIDVNITDKEPL